MWQGAIPAPGWSRPTSPVRRGGCRAPRPADRARLAGTVPATAETPRRRAREKTPGGDSAIALLRHFRVVDPWRIGTPFRASDTESFLAFRRREPDSCRPARPAD